MRVAYLINQYPKVSHTFIRREILALEKLNIEIKRYAIRGWDTNSPDKHDHREQTLTRYILRDGPLPLVIAFCLSALLNTRAWLSAIRLTWKIGRNADRPLAVYLIYLAEACRIAEWCKVDEISHIHAHFGTNAATVAMLSNELGGPSWSFTVHGPEEFDKPQAINLATKLKHCKFAVAVSSFGRSQLLRWVDHEHWHKIHVIRCGLDFTEFPKHPEHSASNRLICVGRLCEQKGQLLLIDAVHRLKQEGIHFELVLAGDGEMRPAIQQLIDQHDLRHQVRITGWISNADVKKEILAARALVLPSFAEGLPVAIMEAMALGRPVISTYVAGIPELVQHEKNGWLVPAGNTEYLYLRLRECLLMELPLLAAIGSRAESRVREMHDIDSEVGKLLRQMQAYKLAKLRTHKT